VSALAAAAAGPLDAAVAFARAHETPWPRDPHAEPGPGQVRWGVHHDDPAPWNRLRGPVHAGGGPAGVVVRHGREVAAWGDPERADLTFSVAKTYLALLAGVAHGRSLLPDPDRPVAETLPGIGFDGPGRNAEVTWTHLLTQTSEWEGTVFGLPDTVDRWRRVAQDPRPAGGPKGGARPLHAPGAFWEYNDVRINQLALALLHLFRRPLGDVFREAILEPLGGGAGFAWRGYDDAWVELPEGRIRSVPGGTHWGGGVSISARDQARVGGLILAGGAHGGRHLVPGDWIRAMAEPVPVAPFYGRLVWRNPGGRAFPGASEDALFLIGAGGHWTWVDPGLDAVVVLRWLDPAHGAEAIARFAAALRGPGG
jgi:CubicO group peptidase (beta-lactamase class C family)